MSVSQSKLYVILAWNPQNPCISVASTQVHADGKHIQLLQGAVIFFVSGLGWSRCCCSGGLGFRVQGVQGVIKVLVEGSGLRAQGAR